MSYFSDDQRSESCRVLAHQCGKAQFAKWSIVSAKALSFFLDCMGYVQDYLIVGLDLVLLLLGKSYFERL